MRKLSLVLFILCASFAVNAVESVVVQGLFSKKAVVLIDGNRHVLSVGKTSPEGVKLISANSRGATLEINGQRKEYGLGNASAVSATFSQRDKKQEKVYVNSAGMYLSVGSINGRSVRFLLDTGATAVTMNIDQAKKLGINYKEIGTSTGVSTASGFEKAYRVLLKSVAVGGIKQSNVVAVVIEGKHPGPILLGMSFLGHLNIQHDGTAMTLTQKN